jgi:hypothetical protein
MSIGPPAPRSQDHFDALLVGTETGALIDKTSEMRAAVQDHRQFQLMLTSPSSAAWIRNRERIRETQYARPAQFLVFYAVHGPRGRHCNLEQRTAMVMRMLRFGRVLKVGSVALAIGILVPLSHGQQDPGIKAVLTMVDPCIANLGYVGCMESGMPQNQQKRIRLYFAAIALSASTMDVGGAHGRGSRNEAEETAIQNCHRNGAKDCKVVGLGSNRCIALATSYADKSWGFDGADNRDGAASAALRRCRNVGGKNCVLITSPCAGDSVQWASPLPLPIGVNGGKVDPVLVGTWIMIRNPGQWAWRIANNGTYVFHSAAMDNAPPNNGTLTATGGRYALHALSMNYDDEGTYVVKSRDEIVATGKLGTGTWKRAQ